MVLFWAIEIWRYKWQRGWNSSISRKRDANRHARYCNTLTNKWNIIDIHRRVGWRSIQILLCRRWEKGEGKKSRKTNESGPIQVDTLAIKDTDNNSGQILDVHIKGLVPMRVSGVLLFKSGVHFAFIDRNNCKWRRCSDRIDPALRHVLKFVFGITIQFAVRTLKTFGIANGDPQFTGFAGGSWWTSSQNWLVQSKEWWDR